MSLDTARYTHVRSQGWLTMFQLQEAAPCTAHVARKFLGPYRAAHPECCFPHEAPGRQPVLYRPDTLEHLRAAVIAPDRTSYISLGECSALCGIESKNLLVRARNAGVPATLHKHRYFILRADFPRIAQPRGMGVPLTPAILAEARHRLRTEAGCEIEQVLGYHKQFGKQRLALTHILHEQGVGRQGIASVLQLAVTSVDRMLGILRAQTRERERLAATPPPHDPRALLESLGAQQARCVFSALASVCEPTRRSNPADVAMGIVILGSNLRARVLAERYLVSQQKHLLRAGAFGPGEPVLERLRLRAELARMRWR